MFTVVRVPFDFSMLVLAGIGIIVEVIVTRRHPNWPVPAPLISLSAGFILSLATGLFSILAYRRVGYLLREHDLVVQSGVIFKVRRCIPRSRIQHVDIKQGPIDSAFGIVEVHLFVAGQMGEVASIPGLSPQAAESLKEALLGSQADGV